jgi:uncharacterized cupin superfamily protein
MNEYKIDFERIEWESPIPGVRHKVRRDGSKVMRLVEYSRDMAPHWCDRGHFGHIVSGRFEIEFDSGIQIFEPGDFVFIPSGDTHRHRAKTLTDTVTAVFVEDVQG